MVPLPRVLSLYLKLYNSPYTLVTNVATLFCRWLVGSFAYVVIPNGFPCLTFVQEANKDFGAVGPFVNKSKP